MQEDKSYYQENRELPTPSLMDAVRKLILDRATDLDTNLSELSRQIGKNHAYLQQFIKRGVPLRLPEDVRAKLAPVLNVPEQMLKTETAGNAGAKAGVSQNESKRVADRDRNRDSFSPIPGAQLTGERDLPVFAAAQGGTGVLVVSSDPVEWVARPEPLAGVSKGYGVIILENSMSPEFEPGDIALVHPHLPPKAGSTCIFKKHNPDGTIEAVVKRLRRTTVEAWHVRQWNPPEGEKADFVLKRAEWQECHVTVGRYTRR